MCCERRSKRIPHTHTVEQFKHLQIKERERELRKKFVIQRAALRPRGEEFRGYVLNCCIPSLLVYVCFLLLPPSMPRESVCSVRFLILGAHSSSSSSSSVVPGPLGTTPRALTPKYSDGERERVRDKATLPPTPSCSRSWVERGKVYVPRGKHKVCKIRVLVGGIPLAFGYACVEESI